MYNKRVYVFCRLEYEIDQLKKRLADNERKHSVASVRKPDTVETHSGDADAQEIGNGKTLVTIFLFLFNRVSRWRQRNIVQEHNALRQRECRAKGKLSLDTEKAILSPACDPKPQPSQSTKRGDTIKFPKSYKKRASEFHKCLPKRNKIMRCAVTIDTFNRVSRSPCTRDIFPQLLRQSSEYLNIVKHFETSVCFNRQLWKDVRQLSAFRTKGKFEQIKKIRDKWKTQGLSLRKVARSALVTFNHLLWLVTQPPKSKAKVASQVNREQVCEFFRQTNITMKLPHKRYSRYHYMRTSFKHSYAKYTSHMRKAGLRVVSKATAVRALSKKEFKPASKVPFQQCLCGKCENFNLAILAAVFAKVKGISRSITETICSTLCDVSNDNGEIDILKCNRSCVRRLCNSCKHKFGQTIATENSQLDMSKSAIWHQWESDYAYVNGLKKKINYSKKLKHGTIADLVGLIKLQLLEMPLHQWMFKWQGDQFELRKSQLIEGEVLMVMDFAKNLNFERQREVQTAFFHRKASTLHAVVCYYKCPLKCGKTVTDEVMCISNDLVHDAHAVHVSEKKALQLLTQRGIDIQKVIQFTDNCTSQYKCYMSFAYISKCTMPLERHYFGEGHGKGPSDASVGRTKKEVDAAIHGGLVDIQKTEDLVDYCRASLATPLPEPGTCVHFQRLFVHIPMVDRSIQSHIAPIAGSSKMHCICNTGDPFMVSIREASCFCR